MTLPELLLSAGLLVTSSNVPILAPAALHPGQLASVRTVFAGDSIETFDAVILGVMDGGRSDGQVILARATSERVIACGIAQGMSGSPVYVDGKLIGALSSGWSFSKEPIFGITPIGEMLDVLDRPDALPGEGSSGPSGVEHAPSARYRELSWADEPQQIALASPAPGAARPALLALPLAAGGLNPALFDEVSRMFASNGFTVTPGGRASGGRSELVPGSPVAVDLLRGDLNFSAIGTVTYRDGDRVLIFGHPFFQAGAVRLPLSTAHIYGIMASVNTSFKLGVPGTPVGAATQDRRPAVAGRIGVAPQLLPFAVSVEQDGRRQEFHFEAVEDRMMLPQLVAAAAMNSVMEAGGGTPMQTVEWTLTAWRGGQKHKFGDIVAGESPLADAAGGASGPLRFLYANSFERFALDSLRLDFHVMPGRQQWTLRAATLGAPAVRPGGIVRVRAEIERWRGERSVIGLDVHVPEELPDGRYSLFVGGGAECDRLTATRVPSRFRPTSVADAWNKLAAVRSADALYVAVWARAPQVTSDGEDFPELPGSALAVLVTPQSSGDRARRSDWAVFSEHGTRVNGMLRGEVMLELNVDRKAP